MTQSDLEQATAQLLRKWFASGQLAALVYSDGDRVQVLCLRGRDADYARILYGAADSVATRDGASREILNDDNRITP